ncbi:MAG: lipopolysaccharide biosynthesis protein [Bacteroidaceae bacterium]|nr:lipopolysaccharide biosynthesis protein [Bacteroidaceae bacterium]
MMSDSLKQKTLSGLLWTFFETFAIQGFGFIQGIVLARLLMPSDYGLIAMTGVFFAVSYALVDTGFTSALIRKKERTDIDYSTVYVTNVVLSFVLCLVLCLCAPFIAEFYNEPQLFPIVCANAVLLFVGSFIAVQGARLSIQLDFKTKSKISVISTVSTGIISIIFALLGFGVWSLILPNFFAVLIKGILYYFYQHWFPGFRFSWQSYKEFFSYGSKLMASSLLNAVYGNVYSLVIGKFYSASSLGYYTKGHGYATLPSATLSGVLNKVTFPVLSKVQDDDARLENAYRKMIRVSAYVVFPIMILLVVLARPLVLILLTDKWENCVIYLQVLCFAMMWNPIHSLNLNLLFVKGRSELFLRLEIVKKIIGATILCVTIPFGLVAMCCGQVVSSLIFLFVNTYYTGKLIHVGFVQQMKDLLPTMMYTAIMGLFVWLLSSVVEIQLVQLLVGFLLGIPLYVLTSKVLKSQEYFFMRDIVKQNVSARLKLLKRWR